MQISMITGLVLNRKDPWYVPSGHVPEDLASIVKSANILGFDLEGLCIASVIAAEHKLPCSYIRKATKGHGIPRKIEGTFDATLPFIVIVEENALNEAKERFASFEGTISNMLVFSSQNIEDPCFEWKRQEVNTFASDAADIQSMLRQFLTIQHGDFRLSSGKMSKIFYDTIPACCRYDVAHAVGALLIEQASPFRIGMAHAGCYLAAVAAQCAGKQPVFFDPRAFENQRPPDFLKTEEPYIVIDDFVTTGKAFESARNALMDVSTKIHYVAAYSRGDIQRLANTTFEVFYECDK